MLFRSGCETCRSIGYAGRMALFEVFWIDSTVRRMLLEGADGDQIRKYAVGTGMPTLKESGLRHAMQGDTSLDEVMGIVADQD